MTIQKMDPEKKAPLQKIIIELDQQKRNGSNLNAGQSVFHPGSGREPDARMSPNSSARSNLFSPASNSEVSSFRGSDGFQRNPTMRTS